MTKEEAIYILRNTAFLAGLGRTPNDAIEDLRQKLSRQTDRAWK